ncbi:MAG: DNA topoisomerase IB [Polyangiales bacterium]
MLEPIAAHPSLLPTLETAASPAVARAVGLRYVADGGKGITRRRAGKGFSYRSPDGAPIKDEDTLRRIRSLAIPPAYRDVWICADPLGHLQATGRDAKGRKQYRYHARWREVRDAVKFHRMLAFAAVLPRVREATDKDLQRQGLPREKVLALVVRLLERTRIRVGNEEYARDNESYGLTTMRNEHVEVRGATVRFAFRGKSGKSHEVAVTDRRLARVLSRCLEIDGQELFQYLDDSGQRRSIDSSDVNAYLREITGDEFTAKDFRTWAGTVHAAAVLRDCDACTSQRDGRAKLKRCLDEVSKRLGNTPAVCRKAYVHPAVFESFTGSWLGEVRLPTLATKDGRDGPGKYALDEDEKFAVALLRHAQLRHRRAPTLEQQLAKSAQAAANKHAPRAA